MVRERKTKIVKKKHNIGMYKFRHKLYYYYHNELHIVDS